MIRLTDEEKAIIDLAAEVAGQPTATWVRDEILRLAKATAAPQPATKPASPAKRKAAKKA
ncbi:MAG: hypothetical protein KF777_01030 [Planctomycetaceae bacterium]|nr:hypothetical protein [Planctomycetaceae bacterium]